MAKNTPPGPGVDASGQAVLDPTKNVEYQLESAVRRIDDIAALREEHRAQIELLRERYQERLDRKEAERVDALRREDLGNVQRAADVQSGAQQILANNVALVAEQVRTTLAAALDPINTRLGELTRVQYEQQGAKANTSENTISSRAVITIVISIIGLLILIAGSIVSLAGFGLALYVVTKKP